MCQYIFHFEILFAVVQCCDAARSLHSLFVFVFVFVLSYLVILFVFVLSYLVILFVLSNVVFVFFISRGR